MLMKDLNKKYVSIILSILIALTGICIEKNNTDVFFHALMTIFRHLI